MSVADHICGTMTHKRICMSQMTHSDLRERVARAICDIDCWQSQWDNLGGFNAETIRDTYRAAADAAIALVLEEAAKECERMECVFAPQQVITDRCAAAIRAMKGNP